MDLKAVIETSTEALTEQAEKVAANISPSLTHLAETPLGQQIASIVTKAGAKAEQALHNGGSATSDAAAEAEADEDSPQDAESSEVDESAGAEDHSGAEADPQTKPSPELVEAVAGVLSVAAAEKAEPSELAAAVESAAEETGSGTHKALVIGGSLVAAGAAAAAAVVVYRRRKGGQDDEDRAGESQGAVVTPITPNVSDADDAGSPQDEAEDKENQMTKTVEDDSSFAQAIDKEAEHFAEDFVDHIDEEDVVVDPEFTIEVDAEADHFAQELVDSIVVTDEDVAAEEELEKQG
jgi:hypothetical protein